VNEVQVRTIIRETLALYESSAGIEVEQRHLRVAPTAHGWYSAVRRLSMAVFT